MPFDDKTRQIPAKQSQVGTVSINVAVALISIRHAIEKIAKKCGADVEEEMEEIFKAQMELSDFFKEMTGWVDEDGG